jgi:predicted nucleotidyltransferase
MITHKDQLHLLEIISNHIDKDIECYAFGGTAMMFYGYKDETKDVDLLFEKPEDRKEFIRALEKLNFKETSPIKIYIPEKLRDPHRPLMYKNEDIRFDLFTKKIFKTLMSPKMKEDLFAIHEFAGKNNLKVKVLRTEHIVLLKGVTERQNDFDDIRTILEKTKDFDWQYLVEEIEWQFKEGNDWALLDMEKVMKELKEYTFIHSKYLDKLYEIHDQKAGKGSSK